MLSKEKKRVWSLAGENKKTCLHYIPPLPHMHSHQALVGCGYVVGLSGLLTGLPPFITTGSLVLLLGGTAALGTVSPTSCSDGSLYMATRGADMTRENRETRQKLLAITFNLFFPEIYT